MYEGCHQFDKNKIFLLLFTYGFLNSSSIVCYSSVSELYNKNIQGTALGFANALSVLISAVFQQMVGFIIDFIREKRIINNYSDYVPDELEKSMLVIIVTLFISIFLSFFIKETLKVPKRARKDSNLRPPGS